MNTNQPAPAGIKFKIMEKSEIKLEKKGFNMSANTLPARSHFKNLMEIGRLFPITRSQAKHFCKTQNHMDVLNYDDVEVIERLMNKHGLAGNYKYTKSKRWVRLLNIDDLKIALRKEYNL